MAPRGALLAAMALLLLLEAGNGLRIENRLFARPALWKGAIARRSVNFGDKVSLEGLRKATSGRTRLRSEEVVRDVEPVVAPPTMQERYLALFGSFLAQTKFLALAFGMARLLNVPVLGPIEVTWKAAGHALALLILLTSLAFRPNDRVDGSAPPLSEQEQYQQQLLFPRGLRTPAWEAMTTAVLVGIAAGVAEEVFFRSFLPSVLEWGTGGRGWLAAGLSAAIFGVAHAGFVPYSLVVMGVGVLFSFVYSWTGNLLVPIAAHSAYDIICVIALYLNLRKRRRQAIAAAAAADQMEAESEEMLGQR